MPFGNSALANGMRQILFCGLLLFGTGCSDRSEDFPVTRDPPDSPESVVSSQPGDILWQLDLSSDPLVANPPTGVAWQKQGPDGLPAIVVEANAIGKSWVGKAAIDIAPFRGKEVSLECTVKLDTVTKPVNGWEGVMVQLALHSDSAGKMFVSRGNIFGKSDWNTYTVVTEIPLDAVDAVILLGLSNCAGKAWIKDVKIRLVHDLPFRPLVLDSPLPRTRPMRGVMLRATRVSGDFSVLKGWNTNLVSWQLSGEKITMDSNDAAFDAWLTGRLKELDAVLSDARRFGMKVNVVMQSPLGGRDAESNVKLYRDGGLQRRFVSMWKTIALRYKDSSDAIFGYDLLSEPVQTGFVPDGLLDWREIQVVAAKAIRSVDPRTPILIQVDEFDSPSAYRWMSPIDLPYLIYELHMYYPHSFTHQGIFRAWGAVGGDPLVTYPGTMDGTATGKTLDKAALKEYLKPVRDFQLAYRVPIFVGEFSVARWAPGGDRYLTDLTSIFEEWGWDWAYFTYREATVWDLEMADTPYGMKDRPVAAEPTGRFKAIQGWFSRNSSPY